MEKTKTYNEIKAYEETKAKFTDFPYFEDGFQKRCKAKKSFINGKTYVPEYSYPKLDSIAFNDDISNKKDKIYKAVLELEAAKSYSSIDSSELELYASSLESRLKKIMLVEASSDLYDPFIMSDSETNKRGFGEVNESLYGKYDEEMYLGILNTERQKIDSFSPKNELACAIKSDLSTLLSDIDTSKNVEKALLDKDDIGTLHDYVLDRYSDILDVVPNTPSDVYFDVKQCCEIMSKALKAGGLEDWLAEENPLKVNVVTNSTKKRIYLPSNTRRNADELKRLIIHEQEVHARRLDNGEKSGVGVLGEGTANYLNAEEGLAVMLECAVKGDFNNASIDRARNRYITAGLALGADGEPRDARETFEIMWRLVAINDSIDGVIDNQDVDGFKDKAYSFIENAYRGTQFWMKGIIYTKLKIYYEGLVANAHYLKNHINDLDKAFSEVFVGKYDHTNPRERGLVLNIVNKKE